jgi:hypothetical protein
MISIIIDAECDVGGVISGTKNPTVSLSGPLITDGLDYSEHWNFRYEMSPSDAAEKYVYAYRSGRLESEVSVR